MNKPIYILGTGLSHNGSAVLLKDGKVCVAIEKERITRIKHDGGNDTVAIQYCLDAENITIDDISLVVQCENFTIPCRDSFKGKRIFSEQSYPEIIDISHHLAHAYSAIGTSPFNECAVIVIDGCGSPLEHYLELNPEEKDTISEHFLTANEMLCEKDSFYFYDGQELKTIYKDFSPMAGSQKEILSLPTTRHSIGGFYAAVSHYVFGNMDDVGKLMGLAPYGKTGVFNMKAFYFENQNLYVSEDWKAFLNNPSKGYDYFKEHFSYYANVAKWAQEQVEKAILKCITNRYSLFSHPNLCYSGGVALNAVANAKLQDAKLAQNIYWEPAAADNGLALGCAFYGWLHQLKMPKIPHNNSTCFGKKYTENDIQKAIQKKHYTNFKISHFQIEDELLKYCASKLNSGKTIAWFHAESEFGPRALGRRSILAHPGIKGIKQHINRTIKFREDFRPFAPAVPEEKVSEYFEKGRNSPYMILVDKTREKYSNILQNTTHEDGSARVQTVNKQWNERFYKLIEYFEKESGIAILLNTSLNRRGMPVVETPEQAIALFEETSLDILVLENFVIEKINNPDFF
ncbi:MAG TPA: carbamoyltransferase C-terminal domain-containing protein [Flavobacterium sp.]|nr:carbamoyltransferase C-terminal domain-containing protein [Flavobacterium sp.]